MGPKGSFEVTYTEVIGNRLLAQNRGQVHHEKGEIGRVGDCLWRDIHEIFQSPVLLGIAKVELNLEPKRIVIHDLCGAKLQVGAKQDHMTPSIVGKSDQRNRKSV